MPRPVTRTRMRPRVGSGVHGLGRIPTATFTNNKGASKLALPGRLAERPRKTALTFADHPHKTVLRETQIKLSMTPKAERNPRVMGPCQRDIIDRVAGPGHGARVSPMVR